MKIGLFLAINHPWQQKIHHFTPKKISVHITCIDRPAFENFGLKQLNERVA